MTTNADLIRHVRRLADLVHLVHGDRIVLLNTADALEAAEEQVANWQETAEERDEMIDQHMRLMHGDMGAKLSWPADLLEAVRIAALHCGHCSAAVHSGAKATLVRYGLMKEGAGGD